MCWRRTASLSTYFNTIICQHLNTFEHTLTSKFKSNVAKIGYVLSVYFSNFQFFQKYIFKNTNFIYILIFFLCNRCVMHRQLTLIRVNQFELADMTKLCFRSPITFVWCSTVLPLRNIKVILSARVSETAKRCPIFGGRLWMETTKAPFVQASVKISLMIWITTHFHLTGVVIDWMWKHPFV